MRERGQAQDKRRNTKFTTFYMGTDWISVCLVRTFKKIWLFRGHPSITVVFGLFCETNKHFFFRFVLVCFGVSYQYRNNQNKQNFLKTNRKNLQEMFFIRGSSKPLLFFLGLNQNKPKLNLFRCFSVCFFTKPTNFFFRFVSMFRTGIETSETNRTYGMGN